MTPDTPLVELASLDELWFQVSGTLCNLECTHCFISCSPKNDRFGYLSLATVERMLEESIAHGVKDSTMPIDVSGRKNAKLLKEEGYDVTYHEHPGGHGTPREIVRESIEWFLGPQKAQKVQKAE